MDIINHPCWDKSESLFVKSVPVTFQWLTRYVTIRTYYWFLSLTNELKWYHLSAVGRIQYTIYSTSNITRKLLKIWLLLYSMPGDNWNQLPFSELQWDLIHFLGELTKLLLWDNVFIKQWIEVLNKGCNVIGEPSSCSCNHVALMISFVNGIQFCP